jgi:hypothetical protein
MAQAEMAAATTQTAAKKEGRSFNLKAKVGEKWKTYGTAFFRADGSGGVGTLFNDDGTKIENVSIFADRKVENATEGRSYAFKTKVADKWKLLATAVMREDHSGGKATILKDDGTKLEVAVFLNDKKYAGAKRS